MALAADIFIAAMLSPDTLRAGVARAFGLPSARVAIRREDETWPDADVVLEPFDDPNPGDYPLQFIPWVPDLDAMPAALSALAHELGAPVLTSDDERDEIMNLYLPDGSRHDVDVDQDEDDGIRNTPEMRRLIAEHARPAAIAS